MRISLRLIEECSYLAYLKETHGLYCKIYSSPLGCDYCVCNCKYGHINNDAEIKKLERKIRNKNKYK